MLHRELRSAGRLASLLVHKVLEAPSSQQVFSLSSTLTPVLSTVRCISSSLHPLAQAQPQPSTESTQQAGPTGSTEQGQQQQQEQQRQQEQQQQGASSSSNPGEDVKQRLRQGFNAFRSTVGDGNLLGSIASEVKDVFKSGPGIQSATRKYTGPVADLKAYDGPAALMLVEQQQTAWQRFRQQMGSIPIFSRLSSVKLEETAAYKRAQELVADLKEKYENSDHPIVHKAEEIKESIMTGSESSRAMKEIRTRDPTFDMNQFVRSIKLDAPVVTQAFLKHDLATLELHCGPELLDRFRGIFQHFTQQGMFEDPTILFVGDVEIVEVRLMEDDPFIIAQFHCQQLKCTRDKFGNVIDGSADSIQRVFYFWGLQQEKVGVVTADGKLLPPRWVIKDMMWQSMLALV